MNVIVEICAEKWDLYVNDFEKHILDSTSDYYRRKATKWIDEDDSSFPKYLVKARSLKPLNNIILLCVVNDTSLTSSS